MMSSKKIVFVVCLVVIACIVVVVASVVKEGRQLAEEPQMTPCQYCGEDVPDAPPTCSSCRVVLVQSEMSDEELDGMPSMATAPISKSHDGPSKPTRTE